MKEQLNKDPETKDPENKESGKDSGSKESDSKDPENGVPKGENIAIQWKYVASISKECLEIVGRSIQKNGAKVIFMVVSAALLLVILLFAKRDGDGETVLSFAEGLPEALESISDKKVEFVVNGEVVDAQKVRPGECPVEPEIELNEGTYLCWYDSKGMKADLSQPIKKNTTFEAVIYSEFSADGTFFGLDENDMLHPEDVVSAKEVIDILHSIMVDPGVRIRVTQRFHDLGLEELKSLKGSELLLAMADCAPEDNLVETFSRFDLEQTVTKRMLAKVYLSLAGAPEKVIFSDGVIPPRDVSMDDEDAEILLLSSVPYIVSEEGKSPREAILDRVWPTGFHLMGGALYYADEEGKLTRNDSIGILNFDESGCQTSGDEELDQMVRERIAAFVEEAPAATMEELLMKAFEYARDNIYYVNRGEKKQGEVGWENEEAKGGFTTGTGNCYTYAGEFCVMARGLGYQMNVISGGVLKFFVAHGWCDCWINGERFFYDPEMAMRDATGVYDNGNNTMFKIVRKKWPLWCYTWSNPDWGGVDPAELSKTYPVP